MSHTVTIRDRNCHQDPMKSHGIPLRCGYDCGYASCCRSRAALDLWINQKQSRQSSDPFTTLPLCSTPIYPAQGKQVQNDNTQRAVMVWLMFHVKLLEYWADLLFNHETVYIQFVHCQMIPRYLAFDQECWQSYQNLYTHDVHQILYLQL